MQDTSLRETLVRICVVSRLLLRSEFTGAEVQDPEEEHLSFWKVEQERAAF